MGEPVLCPFTVLIDHREPDAYQFRGLQADCKAYGESRVKGGEDLVVMTRLAPLPLKGYTVEARPEVFVHRLTLSDWYACCGVERDAFEERLEALSRFWFPAVVIEATLEEIATQPPPASKLNPKTAYRSLLAWSVRHRLPIIPAGPRPLAEVTTFRLLERAWKEHQVA